MISDTLSEAVMEIDRYLAEPAFGYDGPVRSAIVRVRNEMDGLRTRLDTAPDAPPQYTLHVTNEPDSGGMYFAHVQLDGEYVTGSTIAAQDRNAAVAKVTRFVEWHRSHDAGVERIAL